ncbi:DUF1275 domain-containing protein [Aureimonas fodinaquatilis]|uniref:DUF1275 domain-containing protein n=1 Tax=Aureimonas fodinaquatilis TaxID=2565783 RepID=A0A5B0E0G1_9HYPH|nr:YoaK family protein [Aureimonas fodinaquatilis]KAA0971605.1 DUF1275 domain-containing protein [Aureimonas fodinaquatilis]
MTRHRRRHRRLKRQRVGAGLLLTSALAMLAGMTDVIGLMMIGHYISFMSGNTTELAAALVGGDFASAALMMAILLVFVLGNTAGEVFIRLVKRNHVPLLFLISALIAMPMLAPGSMWAVLLTVLAMGMLNSGIEQIEGQAFGITFITGALSRFGRGLGRYLMGERQGAWTFQIVPWAGMFAGALVGALAYQSLQENALLVPTVFNLFLGVVILLIPRHWRHSYVSPPRVRLARPAARPETR